MLIREQISMYDSGYKSLNKLSESNSGSDYKTIKGKTPPLITEPQIKPNPLQTVERLLPTEIKIPSVRQIMTAGSAGTQLDDSSETSSNFTTMN